MKKSRKERQSVFVGDVYATGRCGFVEVVAYKNSSHCSVKFSDGTVVEASSWSVRCGNVSNPNFPSRFTVGYLGHPKFPMDKSDRKTAYSIWSGMMERCYSGKYTHYQDCSVDAEWHNFQRFCEWFMNNKSHYQKGWHLDKDILIKGNHTYGPKSCAFVPREVNSFLILRAGKRGDLPLGVTYLRGKYQAQLSTLGKQTSLGTFETIESAFYKYKVAKELEAKRLAELYKGVLREDVYSALLEYRVCITD